MKQIYPAEAAQERQMALEHLLRQEGLGFAQGLHSAVEHDIAALHPLFDAFQTGTLRAADHTLLMLAQALIPVAATRSDLSAGLFVQLMSPASGKLTFEQLAAGSDASRGCGPTPQALRRLIHSLENSVTQQAQGRERLIQVAQQSRDRCLRLLASERPGCALGAIAALDWSWAPIAARVRAGILRHATLRPALSSPFEIQPNQAETLRLLETLVGNLANDPASRRALLFGASQALADRALLWDAVLDLSI
jgi:hypothetical protein